VTAVLTVALAANAALAYASLTYIVPSCARSRFRYRLWALRDQVMDEIYDGRFEKTDQARKLVAAIELVIRGADQLSLLRVWFANLVVDERDLPEHLRFELDRLSASDRDRLQRHLRALHWLIIKHVFVGSVSGWIYLLATRPLHFLRLVRRAIASSFHAQRRTTDDATHDEMILTARNGVHVEPALAVLTHRTRTKREWAGSRLGR
jgi:hypothetical protein